MSVEGINSVFLVIVVANDVLSLMVGVLVALIVGLGCLSKATVLPVSVKN